MKIIKILLSSLCVGMICFSVNAQEKWSLQACFDTAFAKNISLRQGGLNSQVNNIKLAQSKAELLPNLNLTDAHSLNYGNTYEASRNQYVNSNLSINNLSLNSSVTLFNGFYLLNSVRQARLIYDASELDVEKNKNDIMLNVLAAFMQVLMDYEAIDEAQSQMDATSIQVEQTKKFVEFGKVAELSLLQIQSQLAAEKLVKVNAENQLQLDKVTLLQIMNVPVRKDFDIERQELKELFPEIPMSPEEIEKISQGFLPEIKSAALKANASLYNLKMSKSEWLPSLQLHGSLSTLYSSINHNAVPDQFTNYFGQTLGLTLSVPIFNNLHAKSDVDIARINLLNAQLNEEQTKIDLRKNIEVAYTNMVSAGKNLTVTEEQMELEKRTYTDMEMKYSVGAVNATDFLVEKNNYNKVSMLLIQARYDYVLKSKIIDFYLDKSLTEK
jgi:outer membrane protein